MDFQSLLRKKRSKKKTFKLKLKITRNIENVNKN